MGKGAVQENVVPEPEICQFRACWKRELTVVGGGGLPTTIYIVSL
jgi:hypothetical protein